MSEVVQSAIQRKVLENLRGAMVYGNRNFAEMGTFTRGTDSITFISVPDLAVATTPLTEGSPPSSVQLSVDPTVVSAQQFGNLVEITDLLKVKSPVDIVNIGAERLARNAEETMDALVRDDIAASGTPFYQDGDTTRAGLASTDLITALDLRKLRATMFKNHIPTFPDGTYRLIVTAEQGYDIRSDATAPDAFIEVRKYAQPGDIMKGELGMMNGFRIIESPDGPTFSSTVTVHAGIAFGAAKGWGWGDLQSLRAYYVGAGGDHTDPLAQEEVLGWKVSFGVAALANNRYYRLESAATAL